MVHLDELNDASDEVNAIEDDGDLEFQDEPSDEYTATLLTEAEGALQKNGQEQAQDEDEEEEFKQETVLERLAALVDVVPPMTRYHIKSSVRGVLRTTGNIVSVGGTCLWVLVTAAMVLFVPVALEIEREGFVIQQETQQRMQQQQAKQVLESTV